MNSQNTPISGPETQPFSTHTPANYLEFCAKIYAACRQSTPDTLRSLLQKHVDDGILFQPPAYISNTPLQQSKFLMYFCNAFLYLKFAEVATGASAHLQIICNQINNLISRFSTIEEVQQLYPQLFEGYNLFYNAQLSNQQAFSPLIRRVFDILYSALSIHENFQNMNVTSIANVLHVSEKYLSTRFIRETGRTLSNEINTVRVLCAKFFLMYSDLTLEEIAEKCGFSSQNYFTRRFKAIVGLSPKQYRKQMHIHPLHTEYKEESAE